MAQTGKASLPAWVEGLKVLCGSRLACKGARSASGGLGCVEERAREPQGGRWSVSYRYGRRGFEQDVAGEQ